MQQRRNDRRVNTARKSQQYLARRRPARAPDSMASLQRYCPAVQSPGQSHRSRVQTAAENRLSPCLRVGYFGMELHAIKVALDASSIAARGELPLFALTTKPFGTTSTRSPWLIHTSSCGASLSRSFQAGEHRRVERRHLGVAKLAMSRLLDVCRLAAPPSPANRSRCPAPVRQA